MATCVPAFLSSGLTSPPRCSPEGRVDGGTGIATLPSWGGGGGGFASSFGGSGSDLTRLFLSSRSLESRSLSRPPPPRRRSRCSRSRSRSRSRSLARFSRSYQPWIFFSRTRYIKKKSLLIIASLIISIVPTIILPIFLI